MLALLGAYGIIIDSAGNSVVNRELVVLNLYILLDIVLRFTVSILVVNVQHIAFSSVNSTPAKVELGCVVVYTSVVLMWVRCRCSHILVYLEYANIVDEHRSRVVHDVEQRILAALVELYGVCLPIGSELRQLGIAQELPRRLHVICFGSLHHNLLHNLVVLRHTSIKLQEADTRVARNVEHRSVQLTLSLVVSLKIDRAASRVGIVRAPARSLSKIVEHINPRIVIHFIIVQVGVVVGRILRTRRHLSKVLLHDVHLLAIVGRSFLHAHQTRCSLNRFRCFHHRSYGCRRESSRRAVSHLCTG